MTMFFNGKNRLQAGGFCGLNQLIVFICELLTYRYSSLGLITTVLLISNFVNGD